MKAKQLFLLFFVVCGLQGAYAQPPTSAPTPAQAATTVRSLYSNTYTNAGQGFVNPGSWAYFPTEVAVQNNANDKVLKMTRSGAGNAVGWKPGGKEYIHMDVYWESGDNVTFSIIIGAGFNANTPYTIDFAWPALQKGQWVGINVPTQAWIDAGYTDGDLDNGTFVQLRLNGTSPVIYLDNIYAYGTRPAQPVKPGNIPQAPKPTYKASGVASVFSNHYENVTDFTPQAWGSCLAEVVTIPGKSDQVVYLAGLGESPVFINTWDIQNKGIVHIDVYYEDGGTGTFSFALSNDWGGGSLKYPTTNVATRKGQWVSIDIATSEFTGLNLKEIVVLHLKGSGNFYIDNIFAYGKPGDVPGEVSDADPTVDIARAPLPLPLPDNVVSVFSDRYKSVANFQPVNSSVEFYVVKDKADRVAKVSNPDETPVSIHTWNVPATSTIHLDVYYLDGGNGTFAFELADDAAGVSKYSPTGYTFPATVREQWVAIDIPASQFATAGLKLDEIKFIRFKGSGTFFVDNLYAYTTPADDGTFKVRTQFGVNMSGAEFSGDGLYPTVEEDWAYYANKGLNLIRIPFKWERLQTSAGGPLDATALAKLKQAVEFALKYGQVVMFDMHNYARVTFKGESTSYRIGEGTLTREHYADFWRKFAAEFKNYPNIWAYDIMNEPHDMGEYDWGLSAQAAINAIREVDTKTPISIEGNSWASADNWPSQSNSLKDLLDPSGKIIYQAHCYFDADASGTYTGSYQGEVTNPQIAINRLSNFVNWLKTNNKIGMIGELGCPGNDDRWLTMLDDACAFLKANNVSLTYWSGGRHWGTSYPLNIHPDKNDLTKEKPQMAILEKYGDYYFDPVTSIHTVKEAANSVSVFPNPVKDQLTVVSEKPVQNIKVYTLFGKLVADQAGNATGEYSVNLQSLTTGNYFVRVQSEDNSVSTKKIIKL
ncbi:MAG: Endoglucanase [Candidatus Ordinivivax streblomastigis]|uniref:Endoglucanase n=1 Tax=Candidatus Ordinivivax streblomastigis TaxID=2540710 RepID=A0A5M8NZR7_9BACT|nr:MAG: Endoglucanase [Candidatus Ordinivivax streblomastigis]